MSAKLPSARSRRAQSRVEAATLGGALEAAKAAIHDNANAPPVCRLTSRLESMPPLMLVFDGMSPSRPPLFFPHAFPSCQRRSRPRCWFPSSRLAGNPQYGQFGSKCLGSHSHSRACVRRGRHPAPQGQADDAHGHGPRRLLRRGRPAVLIVWATCFKLGQPIGSYSQDLIDYYTEKSTLVLWTSEFLYSWAIFCAKTAVLCFFLRVFRFSSIRVPIMILITLCSIWITIRTFFTLLRCRPIQAFWVQNIQGATCFTNVRAYYLATDVSHSSMDFIILALPIYEVSRMKLPFGQKIAVVGLFATGSLTCN